MALLDAGQNGPPGNVLLPEHLAQPGHFRPRPGDTSIPHGQGGEETVNCGVHSKIYRPAKNHRVLVLAEGMAYMAKPTLFA
jgi:hypothetical protein